MRPAVGDQKLLLRYGSVGIVAPLTATILLPVEAAAASMVIHLVKVTAPKPPGSNALIAPPGAVFEIAPAKVLQGAVRCRPRSGRTSVRGSSCVREHHLGYSSDLVKTEIPVERRGKRRLGQRLGHR